MSIYSLNAVMYFVGYVIGFIETIQTRSKIMLQKLSISMMIVLSSFFVSCTKDSTSTEEVVNNSEQTGSTDEAAELSKHKESGEVITEKSDDTFTPSRIHFKFDNSLVEEAYFDTLSAVADYLLKTLKLFLKCKATVITEEQNNIILLLGCAELKLLKHTLKNMGVKEDQLSSVSYGEHKPLIDEHNEIAWSQNRRVEILVK